MIKKQLGIKCLVTLARLYLILLAILKMSFSHVARYAPSAQLQNISTIQGKIVSTYYLTIT